MGNTSFLQKVSRVQNRQLTMVENSTVSAVVNDTRTFPNRHVGASHFVNSTSYLIQELGFWDYTIYMSNVVLMFLSFFINGLVLKALRKTRPDSLQSSFMIQGIIVCDIFLSVVLGTQVLPYILVAIGCDPVLSIACYESFSLNVMTVLAIIQLYVGLAISVDRLMSVMKPLTYHTTGYSTFQKLVILGGIWVTPIVVYVSFSVAELLQQSGEDYRHICLVQRELSMLKRIVNAYVGPTLVAVAISSTLTLYLVVLGIVIKQRARRRKLTTTTAKLHQSNSSLALTFFLVQLTYLLCYLPAIIQFIFFGEDVAVEGYPSFDITASAITAFIYQCNTISDPLIFAARVRSVRNYIRDLIRKRPRRR